MELDQGNVDDIVNAATTRTIIMNQKPVARYYITEDNDPPSAYDNLTFDPAGTFITSVAM